MERTWKPTAAGVLTIISGVIGIAIGALILVFIGLMGSADWNSLIQQWGGWMPGGIPIPGLPADIWSFIGTVVVVVGIVALIIGVIALVGGVNSLRRRRWGLALAGAILSLFIPVIGTILGILAIIFLALGKKEFT
jgi:uncharacterized membrane protein HdeD (DUF308 family)